MHTIRTVVGSGVKPIRRHVRLVASQLGVAHGPQPGEQHVQML